MTSRLRRRRTADRSRSPVRASAAHSLPARFREILGVPLHLAVLTLLVTLLLGILLSFALDTGTASRVRTSSSAETGTLGLGRNESGLTLLTESSLGPEVQRLVDSGIILPMASFDAAQCLQEQGIPDSVLIFEEVAWGTEEQPAWLMVHGPTDRETLRSTGGSVSATVVRPECGTAAETEPADNLLWTGQVMVGGI